MKKDVKIDLAKMWLPKPHVDTFFSGMPYIYEHFNFIACKDPDYVIYSNYGSGKSFPKNRHKRIFYSPEKDFPNMNECDFAFTHWYDEIVGNSRHMRLPVYTFFGAGENLLHRKLNVNKIIDQKKKFCAFVYYNGSVPIRNRFFNALSKYKKVDAPGRVMNNMAPIGNHKNVHKSRLCNSWCVDKINFLKQYKFVIAFENRKQPGYTTEKIYHPMLANSLPIYWGNSQVSRDFNPKSFINVPSEKHFSSVIDRIVYLDRHLDKYIQILSRPWYSGNKMTQFVDPKKFLVRFKEIFQ